MRKNCLPFVFLLISLWSMPVSAQTPDETSATQLAELEAQAQKLIQEYSEQKKQVDANLQAKLSALGQTPDDRLKRKQLMVETKNNLDQLQENFKVSMDSIREAQNSLVRPKVIGVPMAEPVAPPKPEVTRVMAPREGEVSIAERIRKQDEENAAKALPQEPVAPPPVSAVPPGPQLTTEEVQKKYERKNDALIKKYKTNRYKPRDRGSSQESETESSLNEKRKHVYKTRLNNDPRRAN